MTAGICLAMAGVHMLVWLQNRDSRTSLAFAFSAIGAAATAVFELALMHSQTPVQYGEILRWLHVPLFLLVVSYVWFVRSYLKAGRAWLLWSFLAVRSLILVIDLSVSNIGLHEITALRFVSIGGDTFAVPSGITTPWAYLIRLSEVLLLLFIADTTYAAWNRGRRRQALFAGAAFFVAVVIGATLSVMLAKGTLRIPLTLSMPFLLSTLVMGVDMSLDLLRVQNISRELGESQERMRLAAKAADLGLWEWDIVRDEIWATEAGRARVGADNNETISFNRFLQSVHPDDREAVRTGVQRAVEGADDIEIEYRMVDPAGALQWLLSHGQVERDVNDKALRIRGVSIDITKRKRTEAALYKSEHFARTLLNTTDAMTHILDEDGKIIDLNDSMAKGLGGTREELIGTNVFDRFSRKSAERRLKAFRRVALEQKLLRFEDVDTEKDKMFDTIIFPLAEMQGEKQQFAVFAHDITDIRKMEAAYSESMKRYKAIVESFDGFIYICSQDNRIEFMNQRMIERTGRDAVGEPCYRALHDKDSVCEWCVNDRVFRGETVHWEIQSPKDQRWYFVVNTPIYHTDGTISKQAMIQDITERRNAESESSQLRFELAHLNRVMTMSELSSSLAHEINQPLGAIMNNASAVKILLTKFGGTGGGEVGEILDDIITDANRAGQIIRKIRGIIKKDRGRFEPLDMNTLIKEVVKLLGNPLTREKIVVQDDLSPDLLQVRGDRVQLQQVVMNLIMNAIDAMKGGSSKILTIRTAMQSPGTVMVSITDTGAGIDETMKNRMFESFSTTKKDGLGVGLRICRSILEDHGGRIWAENNAGRGATFSFTLKADSGADA